MMIFKIITVFAILLTAVIGGRRCLKRWLHIRRVVRDKKLYEAWRRDFIKNFDEINQAWVTSKPNRKSQNVIVKDPKYRAAWGVPT